MTITLACRCVLYGTLRCRTDSELGPTEGEVSSFRETDLCPNIFYISVL